MLQHPGEDALRLPLDPRRIAKSVDLAATPGAPGQSADDDEPHGLPMMVDVKGNGLTMV